jgi:hypothetical protein
VALTRREVTLAVLRNVPLFALLDDEEAGVLAGQVELRTFSPRQRIYRIGEAGERAADMVARFGGSWRFIMSFAVVLVSYTFVNVRLGAGAWDP